MSHQVNSRSPFTVNRCGVSFSDRPRMPTTDSCGPRSATWLTKACPSSRLIPSSSMNWSTLLDGNRSAPPKRPHDAQEKARAVRGVIKHASVSDQLCHRFCGAWRVRRAH